MTTETQAAIKDWWIYRGAGDPEARRERLEHMDPPPWRDFDGVGDPNYTPPGTEGAAWAKTHRRGGGYVPDDDEIDAVNTALYLRRPLLVTGKPGVGKSTLAYSIAADLELGPVLHWPITSRSTLRDALYLYDAIARLQDANLHQMHKASEPSDDGEPDTRSEAKADGQSTPGRDVPTGKSISPYLRLGPLGTALLPRDRPRVLLIDEIDKSDIDLPGDLLTVFEDGGFEIPELTRIAVRQPTVPIATDDGSEYTVRIERGRVQSRAFPVIVMTSNGDRDFPPAFRRRCIQLDVLPPGRRKLEQIIRERLNITPEPDDEYSRLIDSFITRRNEAEGVLATDQLLNAIQLRLGNAWSDPDDREKFLKRVMQQLTGQSS
jgi:MoxR-like ATPase